MNISKPTREGLTDALAMLAIVVLLLNLIHYLTKVVPVPSVWDPGAFTSWVASPAVHSRSNADCNAPPRCKK